MFFPRNLSDLLITICTFQPQTLVSRYDWQIEDSQIVVEGDLACAITRKLLWFKKRGPVKQRYVILTSKGALIIYETEYAGQFFYAFSFRIC